MKKFPKETELQKQIIAKCIELGGCGDKIQDKFVKGKADIWLKLPEGQIIFVETKINIASSGIINPEFSIPQLTYLAFLEEHQVPSFGLCFAYRPVWDNLATYYRISPAKELLKTWKETNTIEYTLQDYVYYCDLGQIIEKLRDHMKNG